MNNAVNNIFPLVAESRKRQCADLVTCPVCHVRVPQDKAQAHLESETMRLEKWMRTYVKRSVMRTKSGICLLGLELVS